MKLPVKEFVVLAVTPSCDSHAEMVEKGVMAVWGMGAMALFWDWLMTVEERPSFERS